MGEQPPHLELHLLDAFSLESNGVPVTLAGGPQRVLALLGVQGPVHRGVLAGRLWPESTEGSARGSLRTSLWLLKQRAPGVVEVIADAVRLAPRVEVDLHRFRRAAKKCIGDAEDAVATSDVPALNDLRGEELLPGWYDEWLVPEREQVRQLRLHALEAVSAAVLKQNRHAAALELALEAVRMEPLRESGNAAVIAAHLAEHNIVEALRHYERFRARLWDELGVLPSEELREGLPKPARRALGVVERGNNASAQRS